jgi:hypothetical protein
VEDIEFARMPLVGESESGWQCRIGQLEMTQFGMVTAGMAAYFGYVLYMNSRAKGPQEPNGSNGLQAKAQ